MFHVQKSQFLSIPPDNRLFIDISLSEYSFQNFFRSFLIELNLCKPHKSLHLSPVNRTGQ